MSVIRAFIAISLSDEIHASLEQVSSSLQQRLLGQSVRWVAASNIHLTLKFLGDVSLANLEILMKMLDSEAGRSKSFEISVGEVGVFPSFHRPRVIWVGVEAPAELFALQRAITTETMRLGYAQEEREFSPHLTLGRVSRNVNSQAYQQIGAVLKTCKAGFLGALRVQTVDLYQSDLRPSGAVYRRLHCANLLANVD